MCAISTQASTDSWADPNPNPAGGGSFPDDFRGGGLSFAITLHAPEGLFLTGPLGRDLWDADGADGGDRGQPGPRRHRRDRLRCAARRRQSMIGVRAMIVGGGRGDGWCCR